MKHAPYLVASIGLITLLTGCNISGTWQAIDVSPDDAMFPLTKMTFDAQGRYTATESTDGQIRTSTGSYTWNGLALKLEPTGGEPRSYPGRTRFDGALVLLHKSPETGQRSSATFEKIDPR